MTFFLIALNVKDKALLEEIKKYLKVGTISKYKKK